MLDFYITAGQMTAMIAFGVIVIEVLAPPIVRAIDKLEQLPRRK